MGGKDYLSQQLPCVSAKSSEGQVSSTTKLVIGSFGTPNAGMGQVTLRLATALGLGNHIFSRK